VHHTTVNIIVIGYGLPDLEAKCLESVRRHTTHPYLLTFFDNFESGLSLTEAWNFTISVSPCAYICLLNNDTEVHPNWLGRMYETLTTVPDCGFVGPSTNQCHSPQKAVSTAKEAEAHRGSAVRMDSPISGFCLLFSKETYNQLNGFDPRYALYGQESDFIDRGFRLGLDAYWRQDAFVFHHGEASIKAHGLDVSTEREKAKKLYWGERK